MGKYELPPDYKCPYCGTGHDADYDVWEGVDFEGENDIECKHCGKTFYVYRSWIACYDVYQAPVVCGHCPNSTYNLLSGDWSCATNGCEKVSL